jgi:predicted NBD/HSP70 family sugar kinase
MQLVAGIDLGGTKCLGVLADPDGRVVAERQLVVAEVGSAEAALESMFQHVTAAAAHRGATIAALGLGIPAVIDPVTGLAVRGPNTGWDGFDLAPALSGFPAPSAVENDVNLAALAEGCVGQARGVETYAVIAVGTGLGGAIMTGRHLLRGANNAAGELGVLPAPSAASDIAPSRLTETAASQPAANLEQVLSGAAIARAAAAYVAQHPSAAAELGVDPDARAVFAAARRRLPAGEALLTPVLEALAYAVVALSAVVDPALIILDGSIGRSLAPFLDRIDLPPELPSPPRLVVSDLQPSATALGAIHLALSLAQSTPKEPADAGRR